MNLIFKKPTGFSTLLYGGMLAIGLAACATDSPQDEPQQVFDGDQAIMEINLYAPSEMSRADKKGEDGNADDYSNGTAEENAISNVNFYFYDKLGDFVTYYKGATFTLSDTKDPMVSKLGTAKIVLTGLIGKNHPQYMVAVVNSPSNATSLDTRSLDYASKLEFNGQAWASDFSTFYMTSATHSGNSEAGYYFATSLTPENFALQSKGNNQGDDWPTFSEDDKNNAGVKPVDIYVERLASKVDISFDSGKFTLDETNGYYEMALPTDDKMLAINVLDAGEVKTEKKELKIRLYGWGVNGEAKSTIYFKQVNSGSQAFSTSDGWNFDGTNRSYWAKTPGYGHETYPASFEKVEHKSGEGEVTDIYAKSELLKYISWNDVYKNQFKDNKTTKYVLPHTEMGQQLNLSGNQLRHSAVTEVLIAGRIVDADGNGYTIYQVGDTYYTEDGVEHYILNTAGRHFWKKTTEGETVTISSMTADDIDVKYGYDGSFEFKLTDEAKKVTWYKTDECKDIEKWTNTAIVAELNSYLPDKQTFCYKDGRTYYNIPIRHLRPYTEGGEIKTGMFGVVRNHWYKVKVTGIKSLGHAVYRPEEHIIPPSDDTQYMIGSSIHVLSWRIVLTSAEI